MSETTISETTTSETISGTTTGRPRGMRARRTLATAGVGLLVAGFGVVAVAGQGQAAANVADTAKDALVTIVSTDAYAGSTSAGTGMVLSTTGTVLTNNHVIAGATSIKVTVVSTGASYTAKVVGTDATDDVAVIRLSGASGLKTLPIGDSDDLRVGDDVTATGNAGGTGTLATVSGDVTALEQTITASDGEGSAETLQGLIETDAPIVAGDSGGALIDAAGDVVGINTAASEANSSPFADASLGTTESTGYAIPIEDALGIAKKIEAGQASDTIAIGTHGFLGVQLQSSQGQAPFGYGGGYSGYSGSTAQGATVAGVVQGSAADAAGLTAGDVITAVDGTAVSSADELNTAMAATRSGQSVTLTCTDATGASRTATATLGAAPAA